MFNNFLMTTLTPLRDTNEIHNWDNRPFTTVWPEFQKTSPEVHKEISLKKTIKKKRRYRTAFTSEQLRVLEKTFARSRYIESTHRREIADSLQIDQRCIKIWFQNRRMKEKKESVSGSCDSSSESTMSVSPPLMSATFPDNMTENKHSLQENNQVRTPPAYYPDHQSNSEPQNQFNNYNLYNNFATQAGYPNVINATTANDSFQIDSNIYPTQYYPSYTDLKYYNVEGQNHQYLNSDLQEWTAGTYDTNY